MRKELPINMIYWWIFLGVILIEWFFHYSTFKDFLYNVFMDILIFGLSAIILSYFFPED